MLTSTFYKNIDKKITRRFDEYFYCHPVKYFTQLIRSNKDINIEKPESLIDQKSLAVVIQTCDKYSFCWEGWNYYFQKYWDFSNNCKVYFLNEEKEINFPSIIHAPTGKGEWSDRLRKGLESIPEQYILYMQEDFWLSMSIDILHYFRLFKHLSMDALRIGKDNKKFFLYKTFYAKNIPLNKFSKRSRFLLCHQACIWDKNFFLSCLEKNENPWINEFAGTKRIRSRKETVNIFFTPLKWYIPTCRKGKLTNQGRDLLNEVKVHK